MTATTTSSVPPARKVLESEVKGDYEMLVGGRWQGAVSGERMTVIDPTTEEVIASVPNASAEDIDLAVARGHEAQSSWARVPWTERARALNALADRVNENADELRALDALDGGLPFAGMARDVQNAVDYLRYFGALASEIKGDTVPVGGDNLALTVREPYGVVGRIVPFNHPVQFAAQAIAAPLAAGNAVILKPADYTPLSALRLAQLAEGIIPEGLLSIVTGGGVTGRAISVHPAIRRIGFTGSTLTASRIMADAAPLVKTLSFELGGKNPMVILPDADLRAAASACVQAMNLTRCAGQACGSPSRVFAHHTVRDEFVALLTHEIEALRLGDPLDPTVDVGPLAYEAHYQRVRKYIAGGEAEGAVRVTGGEHRGAGYFVEPTLFDRVTSQMTIAREEIFGPVIAVLEWSSIESMLDAINELDYGLTANIWTRDVTDALRISREIKAGYVYVNGRGQRPLGLPFGGYGISGQGKENDLSELLSYTQVKSIQINFAETP